MADQATEKLQSMNLQDYDSSEFDPLSPQNCKAGNFPYTDSQAVDLLGDVVEVFGGVTNGHGRSVTFDDGAQGLPDPAFVSQSGNSNKELLQRHMSEGEILGYQNEYGESVTHQLEYGLDSDDDDDDNNLVDFGDSQNGPVSYPGPPVDQDYLMSTGQPLLDFSNDLQSVPPLSEQQDLLGGDNFEDCSSQNFEQYQNQVAMDDTEYFDNDVANNAQEQVENDHKTDDIDQNNWQPEMEEEERGVDQSEPLEDNWQPERDSERARRSVSPDRSLSPLRAYSQSEGAEGVTSPQCDTESYENVDSEDISSLSESHPEPTHILQQPLIPHSDAEHSDRSQADQWESDSVTSDASGAPKFRSGVPRLRKIKKAKDLPPWNDNVVLPKQPRVRPTFIGNKEYLPTAGSSPDRPKTAPAHFIAKDASSDSGVEDDKTNGPNKESDEARRKYGTDTKNDRYKPGGGQVQIFSQKVDTKHVSGRTDCKIPKSALSPRSPVKSPTPVRAATPNTKQVQSKIGSLNNVKHSPGGGNVHILSAKPDFSNVKSKVGSKDKLDHKPKGGDKKIESRKLEWKTSSKVGSLKNVEYSPGGGQVKDGMLQVHAPMNTRENIGYTPGGGNVPEPWEEELEWEAEAQVSSLDNLDHVPGGGKVKIFSEKLNWDAEAKVDTGLNKRNGKRISKESDNRWDSLKQHVTAVIECDHDAFTNQPNNDMKINNESSNLADQNSKDDDNIENNKLTTPPPKPPRCIHKQWELEYLKGKEENVEDETDAVLEQQNPNESVEVTSLSGVRNTSLKENDGDISSLSDAKHEIGMSASQLESIVEEYLKPDDIIDSVHNTPDNMPHKDMLNKDSNKKETLAEEESQACIINAAERTNGKYADTTSRKMGIGSRLRGMIGAKKNEKVISDQQRTKSRFTSTSKAISKATSRVGQQKGQSETAGEEVLMAKYLGYVSPKLMTKSAETDKSLKVSEKEDGNKQPNSKHEKCDREREATVEKIANLGYESPKLAKKTRDVVMTGAKKKQIENKPESGRMKGLVKKMSEQFSKYGNSKSVAVGVDTSNGGKCGKGISCRYQDKDIAVKGKLTGSYKINDDGDDGNTLENPAFDYDTDSDVDTDDDREVSYVEIQVNQDHKSTERLVPIQTTTFKYRTDKRPTSPINEIIQEMVEDHKNESDTPHLEAEVFALATDRYPAYALDISSSEHDSYGYAVVNKNKDSFVVPQSVLTDISTNESQYSQGDSLLMGVAAKPTGSTTTKKELPIKDETDSSLDKELRSVLATIGDGETSFLKTPPKYEGTQLGSRPGTPKISVRPIRVKYEEEAKRLEYSRSFSLRGSESEFDRSQRFQSMIVKKNPRLSEGSKNQGVALVRARAKLLHADSEEKENKVVQGLQAGVGGMLEDQSAEKFDYMSKVENTNIKLSLDVQGVSDIKLHQSSLVTVGIGEMGYKGLRNVDIEIPYVDSDRFDDWKPGKKFANKNKRNLINKVSHIV